MEKIRDNRESEKQVQDERDDEMEWAMGGELFGIDDEENSDKEDLYKEVSPKLKEVSKPTESKVIIKTEANEESKSAKTSEEPQIFENSTSTNAKFQDLAKNSQENYQRVSNRLKEEPAGEVLLDEATKVATKSAEYGTKVYNSTKEKMAEFANNGGMEEAKNQAYNKAVNIGNSFWNFVCQATINEQEKLERDRDQPLEVQPKPETPPTQEEKPLWGFTWGK
ncbi:unnamed protein product [Moneuplotes crassus]|uniref:Uncharacterized protein n=1 Tax=Euplotes crassus TaxID=5936 RepID=A0AAD1XNL8_EUPCR|nr:unnamed protein product [Moneuplotes crassus]